MGEGLMKNRVHRVGLWLGLAGGCLFQGCSVVDQTIIDPDLTVRAALSFASELAIFLLDNLAASI